MGAVSDRDLFIEDAQDLIKGNKKEEVVEPQDKKKKEWLDRMKAGKAKAKAAREKWTDEKLDEVVKNNPELGNVVNQLGGFVFDGHVRFKKKKSRNAFIKHLENLDNPDVKLSIAYHGSPHDFDAFTTDAIGTGEGAQVHGWGLYFAKNKEISAWYKDKLKAPDEVVISINGREFKASDYGTENSKTKPSRVEARILNFALRLPIDTKNVVKETIAQLKYELKNYQFDEQSKKDIREALNLLKTADIKIEKIKSTSRLYKVEIPDTGVMLNEQKTFAEQSATVKKGLLQIMKKLSRRKGIPQYVKKRLTSLGMDNVEVFERKLRADVTKETGNKIYDSLSILLGSDEKASKALNEVGIKGITYEGGRDGRCYVVFDDKAIQVLEKWSKHGSNTTSKPTVKDFIDPKDLSDTQRGIAEFGDELGVPVIYFSGDSNLNGLHANGITYLNVNSKEPLKWVFWHETGHWLKANNPELIGDIIDNLAITDKQVEAFRDRTGRYDLTDEEVKEEIFADNMFDADKRLDFMQKLGKKDTSLLKRFVSWLKSVMDRFTSYFNTPKYGLTTAQKNQLIDNLGRELRQLKDSDGNALYRHNFVRHKSEYANGEAIEDYKYSFAGKNALTANMKDLAKAQRMEKAGKSRDEIFYETGWTKGKDNKWRFEIPDNLDNIDFDSLWEEGNAAYLDDIYDNPTLYKAYPFLRNVEVRNEKLGNAWGQAHSLKVPTFFEWIGSLFGSKKKSSRLVGRITLDLGKVVHYEDEMEMQGALVHEIQHIIQEYEDFARGGNPESAGGFENYIRLGGEQEANEVMTRADAHTDIAEHPDGWKQSLPAPRIHSDDAIIVFGGEEYAMARQTAEGKPSNVKYSIGSSSNNNNETFRDKIKNFFTSRNDLNERQRKKFTRALMELSGYKIGYSHTDNDIEVKDKEKVIRTRKAYDWDRILPEIGRITAEQLELSPTQEMNNYIADWILTGAVNNTSQEAEDFGKAMREHPDIAEKLIYARETAQEELNMTATERALSRIRSEDTKKSFRQLLGMSKDRFDEEIRDDLSPIKKAVEEAEKIADKKLPVMLDPYVGGRIYKGRDAILEAMIYADSKSKNDAISSLKEHFPDIDFNGFNPFHAILEEAGGKKELDKFAVYVTAKHVKDIHLANHKIESEIVTLSAKIRDMQEGKEKKKKQAELEKLKKSIFDTPLTEKDCDEIIAENRDKYDAAQKHLVKFSNTFLQIASHSGLISEKSYWEMTKKWKNYVPLFCALIGLKDRFFT